MNKKILLFLSAYFMCAMSFCASLESDDSLYAQQATLIENHLLDPSQNVNQMISYTLDALSEDEDFAIVKENADMIVAYQNLVDLAENFPGYADLNPAQKLFVHGYFALHADSFHNREDVRERILATGKLCSLLLSKDLLSNENRTIIRSHSYPLIYQEDEYISVLLDPVAFNQRELGRIVRQKSAAKARQKFGLIKTKQALPLVLLPPHNIFAFKTFFCALSKEVSLFGLDKDNFPGHGGVFASPFFAFMHDVGHDGELPDGSGLELVADFADGFLHMVENNYFKADTEKALYAAFLMLHETQIKHFTSESPLMHTRKKFNLLFDSTRQRFGEEEFKYYEADFTNAFFSDLAREIVKIHPEFKNELFNDDGTIGIAATIQRNVDLISWLKEQFQAQTRGGLFFKTEFSPELFEQYFYRS